MVLTTERYKEICKYTEEFEMDIRVNDYVSEKVENPPLFPITTLWDKYIDYINRLEKNPDSSRNKENFEYIKFLMRQRNMEESEIPQEVVRDVVSRISLQEESGEYCYGIYGYFDKKKDRYIYFGKDKYILADKRGYDHRRGKQTIDGIIQNDTENRYEYRRLYIIKKTGLVEVDRLKADIVERYLIEKYHTYHYEHPHGMNFTKGGETSFGWESEVKRIYKKAIHKRNSVYKGERDRIKHDWSATMGPDGSTFILTTNGGGTSGRIIIRNADGNKENGYTKRLTNSTHDPDDLMRRFMEEEGFTTKSKIEVSETFQKKYPGFDIKKYGF